MYGPPVRFADSSSTSDQELAFRIEVEGEGEAASFGCSNVLGFGDAAVASIDARAPTPDRLELIAPDTRLVEWLADWSEDADDVRRTIHLSRSLDGYAVRAVATLASFGCGVNASLAVESVEALFTNGAPQRTGVYRVARMTVA